MSGRLSSSRLPWLLEVLQMVHLHTKHSKMAEDQEVKNGIFQVHHYTFSLDSNCKVEAPKVFYLQVHSDPQDKHGPWRYSLSPLLSRATQSWKTGIFLAFVWIFWGHFVWSDRVFQALSFGVSWIPAVHLMIEIQAKTIFFFEFLSNNNELNRTQEIREGELKSRKTPTKTDRHRRVYFPVDAPAKPFS